MKNLITKLFGQSSTYALGKILTSGGGLLLLPVYTRYLSPSEYGILAVATVVVAILGPALTGGGRGAALKFYFEYEEGRRKQFYGSLLTVLVVGSGGVFLCVDFFGEAIFGFAFDQIPYSPYIRMALWLAYVTAVFIHTAEQVLKARGEALLHTVINISLFLSTTAFVIWWVVFQKQGVEGAIRGKLVGTSIVAAVCGFFLFRYARPALNVSMIERAFLYSLPLVPHFLSHWVMSSADRFLLERLATLSDVGVYNVGYQIGNGMSLIASSGNNAIIPIFGKLNVSDDAEVEKAREIFTYYMAVILVVGLCIALFGRELVLLATPEDYHRAGRVIPWVVLAYVFMALYYAPTNLLTITLGQSKVVGIATTIGALANVGLNVAFIPTFGIYGAAVTTTATYLIMVVGVYVIVARQQVVPVEIGRTARLFLAALLLFGVGWTIAPNGIVASIIVKAAVISTYPFVLWVTGFYTSKEMKLVKKYTEIALQKIR
jgi:O-antigen/teichoic acid export membrane protein